MMMTLSSRHDWLELARAISPDIPRYARSMGVAWDPVAFSEYLDKDRLEDAHQALEVLWDALPNASYIRVYPFFHICDLCSESHVLRQE